MITLNSGCSIPIQSTSISCLEHHPQGKHLEFGASMLIWAENMAFKGIFVIYLKSMYMYTNSWHGCGYQGLCSEYRQTCTLGRLEISRNLRESKQLCHLFLEHHASILVCTPWLHWHMQVQIKSLDNSLCVRTSNFTLSSHSVSRRQNALYGSPVP